MDPLILFQKLIDVGVIDLFVSPGKPLMARSPFGVVMVKDLLQLDDDPEKTDSTGNILRSWLTNTANLSPEKMNEIAHKGQADYALSLPARSDDLGLNLPGGIRLRVHAFTVSDEPAFVIRLIGPTPTRLTDLGFDAPIEQRLEKARGLFLVTGPTGAGKSTTLAAILQYIADNYPYHILTFEDPIEYIIHSGFGLIHQRELYHDFYSFADGLRGALRESPDVVMIGEMRDLDTVRWALSLAEAGFLVLATYHTSGAQETIDRIIGSFPEREQPQVRVRLAGSLIGVLSQILLPLRVSRGMDPNFKPRVVAYEYMFKTPAIANLIRENKSSLIAQELTKSEVGALLEHRLAFLVMGGYIAPEVAEANARNPEILRQLIRS